MFVGLQVVTESLEPIGEDCAPWKKNKKTPVKFFFKIKNTIKFFMALF